MRYVSQWAIAQKKIENKTTKRRAKNKIAKQSRKRNRK